MQKLFGFCAIVALFLCPSFAMAGTVDLSPVTDYAINVLGGILSAAAIAVLGYLARKFKIDGDVTDSEYAVVILNDAIEKAIAFAKKQVGEYVNVDVDSPLITTAVNYITPKIPNTLRKLGITEKGLADRIVARLV